MTRTKKTKYNSPMTVINVRVPVEHKEKLRNIIKNYLCNFVNTNSNYKCDEK